MSALGTVTSSRSAVSPRTGRSAISFSGAVDIREALDIDSMDFLRFIVVLHEKLKVDIPEKDYPKVRTLDTCVDYIAKKLEA